MPEVRIFRVHARHVDVHHSRTLRETSFEAAAVAYAEDLHVLPADGEEISIVVREIESGREHCFMVDLQSGETSDCT
jgi:hypothetical protein